MTYSEINRALNSMYNTNNILIYIKHSQTHHLAEGIRALLKWSFPPPLHHGNAPKETTSLIWVFMDPIYFFL